MDPDNVIPDLVEDAELWPPPPPPHGTWPDLEAEHPRPIPQDLESADPAVVREVEAAVYGRSPPCSQMDCLNAPGVRAAGGGESMPRAHGSVGTAVICRQCHTGGAAV